jgi:hemoglobin-like flavoprotein
MVGRIESMTKELGATILISRAVAENLADGSLSVTTTQMARLRGKRNDIELLAVDGFADPSPFTLAQRLIGLLLDDPTAFAAQFYANMFALRPELEGLFINGTAAQGAMLSHMLRSVVSGLGRRKHVTIALQTMGRKHVGYGVELNHYDTFRAAMLKTISDVVGKDLTREIEESWSKTFDVILGLMKEGAGAEFRTK